MVLTICVQGTSDNFGAQLSPDVFLSAAREAGFDEHHVHVRERDGYGHNYYFVRPHSSTGIICTNLTTERSQRLVLSTSNVGFTFARHTLIDSIFCSTDHARILKGEDVSDR